ncbi:hypothetical protein KSP40_PGU014642 [Platanthera guangdongensis]|uniref:Uncharacterized protein n=1 Tax=Platanthera guangdongensis TaxID=2320717 RepID=A0ABR2N319_9ASPA
MKHKPPFPTFFRPSLPEGELILCRKPPTYVRGGFNGRCEDRPLCQPKPEDTYKSSGIVSLCFSFAVLFFFRLPLQLLFSLPPTSFTYSSSLLMIHRSSVAAYFCEEMERFEIIKDIGSEILVWPSSLEI